MGLDQGNRRIIEFSEAKMLLPKSSAPSGEPPEERKPAGMEDRLEVTASLSPASDF